ncbi:hypothetical protein Tco_1416523 [Tanacetum coccineum]
MSTHSSCRKIQHELLLAGSHFIGASLFVVLCASNALILDSPRGSSVFIKGRSLESIAESEEPTQSFWPLNKILLEDEFKQVSNNLKDEMLQPQIYKEGPWEALSKCCPKEEGDMTVVKMRWMSLNPTKDSHTGGRLYSIRIS